MQVARMSEAFEQSGPSFSFKPFSSILQPLIEEVLAEQGKDKFRKGTILIPQLLVWLVLALTVRRDLNCQKVLNWLVSGLRWMQLLFPARGTLVQEGAISHARVKMGVEVFRALFVKLTSACQNLKADFHGLATVIFDGTTGTMPDTESNENEFKRPKSGRGKGAFPQMRIMVLMARSARVILDMAYAAYCGKGTGERTLVMQILDQTSLKNILFLLDAGLYSFEILWKISGKGYKFIVKAPKTAKLKPIRILPDGSYLAYLKSKVLDPDALPTKSGRQRWKKVNLLVRVVRFEIPGYRPVTLVTNLLDSEITAREIALHYHQRWDIEIAYDEIKTHQCVTLRGQQFPLLAISHLAYRAGWVSVRMWRPSAVERVLKTWNFAPLGSQNERKQHSTPCLLQETHRPGMKGQRSYRNSFSLLFSCDRQSWPMAFKTSH